MRFKPYYLRKPNETLRFGHGYKESLDYSDRWLTDGLNTAQIPGMIVTIDVDMMKALERLKKMRETFAAASDTSIYIYAVSKTLQRLPHLHQLVVGNTRYYPPHIDIGVSVAGESFVAPVYVVRQSETKTPDQIAQELAAGARDIRETDMKFHDILRRWGRIIPFAFLRRFIIRFLQNQIAFRTNGVGTFQLTQIPYADNCIPLRIGASVALGVGGTRERVLAIAGQSVVRPTVKLTIVCDHGVWDGMCASQFLHELKKILETEL